jgi:integrase
LLPENNHLIDYNPAVKVPASGGKPAKKKEVLTDEQMKVLLDAVRGLLPYPFIMIGLYTGLRREEILALQWDCVFLNESTPYISVRRAWRTSNGKAKIFTVLKSKAAKRDIPIPKCLVNCLRDAKNNSKSAFVIPNSNGEPMSESQF